MYFVVNITRPPQSVRLPDLRFTIGPNKALDLEKVASRRDIEKSSSLKKAIKSKQLQVRHRTEYVPQEEPEPVSEGSQTEPQQKGLGDDDISKIRDAIKSEVSQQLGAISNNDTSSDQLMATLQRLTQALESGQASPQQQQSAPVSSQPKAEEDDLDPEQLSNIHAKSIKRQSQEKNLTGKIDYVEKETEDDVSSNADELDKLL
jgi:hypothetical protein